MDRLPVWLLVVGSAVLSLAASGCGGDTGPERYQLSGTVTYQGEPIPVGLIEFEPDAGYTGPGESAVINNGDFETPKGLVAGVMKVNISGFDGVPIPIAGEEPDKWGTPIFPSYRTTMTMPAEDAIQDFQVPDEQVIR